MSWRYFCRDDGHSFESETDAVLHAMDEGHSVMSLDYMWRVHNFFETLGWELADRFPWLRLWPGS